MMNNKYIETRATHKTNGNGNYLILVIVAMVCVTVLGAAYMISNGLKSAGSAEAVSPVVVAAAQDTSDETAAVPEAAIADEAVEDAVVEEVVKAADAETEPVKELMVKDTTPLYQLEPVNAINGEIPEIKDITDAWGNEFNMAFDLYTNYEWTYQTDGEYDAITGTILCSDNSGDYLDGTLEIYDGDTDTLLWKGDMRTNMKPKEFEVELEGAQLVTFKFVNHDWIYSSCGLTDVEFVSYED